MYFVCSNKGHADDERDRRAEWSIGYRWRRYFKDKINEYHIVPGDETPGTTAFGEKTRTEDRQLYNCDTDNGSANNGDGEKWDLMKVFNVEELRKVKPTVCSWDECDLIACSMWISLETGEKWFTCLDHQER